jgi:hypothetical protein
MNAGDVLALYHFAYLPAVAGGVVPAEHVKQIS